MKISEGSKFIFIATSSGHLEDRFLYDVNYGITILKNQGVADEDITVVTDATKETLVAKCTNMSNVLFSTSSSFGFVVENADCENLFVISCCHGSISGIDSTTSIKPFSLNQALKNNQYAKNILVFLGQCYAGIFNFMDVRDERKNIVYIGATDINTSLSYTLNGCGWVANISIIALFEWIKNPQDIDGDGIYSITDLYKFVSFFTNNVTKDIEKIQHRRLIDASVTLKFGTGIAKPTNPFTEKIIKDAADIINGYIVPHQNPWMLNAIAAGKMCFE